MTMIPSSFQILPCFIVDYRGTDFIYVCNHSFQIFLLSYRIYVHVRLLKHCYTTIDTLSILKKELVTRKTLRKPILSQLSPTITPFITHLPYYIFDYIVATFFRP
jgi:hypothetical protein